MSESVILDLPPKFFSLLFWGLEGRPLLLTMIQATKTFFHKLSLFLS